MARAAGSGLVEELPPTQMAAALQSAGITPQQFPKTPVTPEQRAARDAIRRVIIHRSAGTLSDKQVDLVIKYGNPELSARAKRERSIRNRLRSEKLSEGSIRLLANIFAGRPLSENSKIRANRLGLGTAMPNGTFRPSRRAFVLRKKLQEEEAWEVAEGEVLRDQAPEAPPIATTPAGAAAEQGGAQIMVERELEKPAKYSPHIDVAVNIGDEPDYSVPARSVILPRWSGRATGGVERAQAWQISLLSRAVKDASNVSPIVSDALRKVKGFGVHSPYYRLGINREVEPFGAYAKLFPNSLIVSVRDDVLLDALSDFEMRQRLAGYLIHEAMHVTDMVVTRSQTGDTRYATRSESHPDFAIKGEGANREATGSIIREAFNVYFTKDRSDPLVHFLHYPFSYSRDATVTNGFIQRELFAQLGRLFYTNPKLMRRELPKAYNLFKNIEERGWEKVANEAANRAIEPSQPGEPGRGIRQEVWQARSGMGGVGPPHRGGGVVDSGGPAKGRAPAGRAGRHRGRAPGVSEAPPNPEIARARQLGIPIRHGRIVGNPPGTRPTVSAFLEQAQTLANRAQSKTGIRAIGTGMKTQQGSSASMRGATLSAWSFSSGWSPRPLNAHRSSSTRALRSRPRSRWNPAARACATP